MSATDRLCVAVIGCGRMGRLHARAYHQTPGVVLAGVYDINRPAAEAVAGQYGCRAFASLEEAAAAVSAATIAVPTEAHLAAARPFLQRGVACLIEKPLAADAVQARQIVDLARSSGALVQVGHIERFNPVVRAIERLQMEPRFIEVIRVSPLTFRSIDVGVVLDMMIHDIDIVLRLARSPLTRVEAFGASVIGRVEDVCNARLCFANGCVANLTASRLAMKVERKLRAMSRNVYVTIDYQKRQGYAVHRSGNLAAIREAAEKVRRGEIDDVTQLNYAELVKVEELAIDDTEPLRAEVEAFVEAVRRGAQPAVPAEDGLAAVEVARRIVEAIGPDMDLGEQ